MLFLVQASLTSSRAGRLICGTKGMLPHRRFDDRRGRSREGPRAKAKGYLDGQYGGRTQDLGVISTTL